MYVHLYLVFISGQITTSLLDFFFQEIKYILLNFQIKYAAPINV